MLVLPAPVLTSPRPSRRSLVVLLATFLLLFTMRIIGQRVFTPYDMLLMAIDSGSAPAVKAVLDRGADVNGLPDSHVEEGVSPLGAAAENGNVAIVRLLLDRGASPNMRDCWESPLMAAAEHERIAVMKLLIARGAEVNDSGAGSDALWSAATQGKTASVRFLLAHGANPNPHFDEGPKNTLLQVVEANHHPAVAALLRQSGAK